MDLDYNCKGKSTKGLNLDSLSSDPLMQILHSLSPKNPFGLAGGDARDLVIGYSSQQGASGFDIYLENEPFSPIEVTRKLFNYFGLSRGQHNVSLDNLAVDSPIPNVPLAIYSYFHTPTLSISKILVLRTEEGNVLYDYSSARKDFEERKLNLDFENCERQISVGTDGSDLSLILNQGEVIMDVNYGTTSTVVNVGLLTSTEHDFSNQRVVELPGDNPINTRYATFDWKQVAKVVRLAVLYQNSGFEFGEHTEKVIEDRLKEFSPENLSKVAEFIAYKIHYEDFAKLPNALDRYPWMGLIVNSNTKDTWQEAKLTLERYKGQRKIFFRPEDNIFLRKRERYYD